MQKAVPVGEGAMAAILGLDFAAVAGDRRRRRARTSTAAICEAANDNGGGQVVISGAKAAVERAMELAKQQGAKRALPLPVSAPFHCALMQPAAEAMARGAGADARSSPPEGRRWSPMSRREPLTDPDAIKRQPRRSGDRHGALARKRRLHGRRRA